MNWMKLALIAGIIGATTLLSHRAAEAQGGGGGGGGFGFGFGFSGPVHVPPPPFSAPQAVNVPRLTLRPTVLTFDQNLNPVQIAGLNLPLSSQALQLTADHNLARQQITLAIAYITTNRRRIEAGIDPFYNQIFGGFYDRTNRFNGTYNIDDSHFLRVLSTYSHAGSFMENPTFYGLGGNNMLNNAGIGSLNNMARSTPILGFDFGERHWGFSNSDSRQVMNDNPPRFGSGITPPAGGPFNPLWDQDNLPLTVQTNPPSFLAAYANRIDSAFLHERMDIYGQPDDPSQQFIGDVFMLGVGRYGGDLINLLTNVQFSANGGGLTWVQRVLEWNSGITAPVQAESSFSPARLERWQYILSSFTEFTTNPNDSRGGAFWGVRDLLAVLDPNGGSSLFGNALDAENFSLFISLLNANGIVDPRTFPPRGKNGQFTPLVPAGFVAQGTGFIPPN